MLQKKFGFIIVIGVVAACGLGLALWADTTDGNRDALREVGGAVVSGAVLAGIVVWFENKRDDERENSAEQRADTAAQAAWRREIDIRLISVVRTDLSAGRNSWLEWLESKTQPRDFGSLSIGGSSGNNARPFANTISEVDALLVFLRDDAFIKAWTSWDQSVAAHQHDVPAPESPKEPDSRFSVSLGSPPVRDLDLHRIAAQAEQVAWNAFTRAIDEYIDIHYPVGGK